MSTFSVHMTSLGCSLTTTKFLDEEKDRDNKAYSEVPSIPTVTFGSELHVIRMTIVLLTAIAGHLVLLPTWVAQTVRSGALFSTPESRHSFAVFLSSAIAIAVILATGFNYSFAYDLMSHQKYYKLWAGYTLAKVIVRFSVRMHQFTHRMLRGAIRAGGTIDLAVASVVRAVSIVIYFAVYAMINACFLAGLLGKEGLFFSAILHIQAVIAKKYFPKPTEGPPNIDEPINRTVMIICVIYHAATKPLAEITLLVQFEVAWALVRFFMTALTEDGSKLYTIMSQGSNAAVWLFNNQDSRFEGSLIVNYPFEVFALSFANMVFVGSVKFGIVIAAGIVAVAFAGPVILNLWPGKPPASDDAKEKKQKAPKAEALKEPAPDPPEDAAKEKAD